MLRADDFNGRDSDGTTMDAVKIDFAKMDGLVPGIVQDAKTGEMLMLGFLNETSYAEDAGDRLCHILEPDRGRSCG